MKLFVHTRFDDLLRVLAKRLDGSRDQASQNAETDERWRRDLPSTSNFRTHGFEPGDRHGQGTNT